MKRIVSLVLALSMVMSMFTFSFAGLKDVEATEYEAAVEALVELGIVAGYPDGTFLPEKVVTRAELAKLLVTAYGLDEAAEASKGPTAFADVNADAELDWATGYINVAADYGFINGYPDGTFNGKATVTYAEAVTMCLRVLGYAREIEAKGTWPTNYMAKAHDLKLLKDISYGSYNDGAKRGDTALLIWNMLRTNMWTVKSESEGDGLLSSATTEMLNVKFPDYKYDNEAIFSYFEIGEDTKNECAEVVVGFYAYTDEETDEVHYDEYTYYGNDFYTFVAGTEVEVLINKEDGVLLTMVPTSEDKLVAGKKDVIDEDYDELSGEAYDYAYTRVVKKDIKDASVLKATSKYIDEITVKEKYATIDYGASSDWKCMYDALDYEIILKDGERILFSKAVKNGDIAAGDIITTVTVEDYNTEYTRQNPAPVFYVVGGSKVEGEFETYEAVEFENSELKYEQLTIDGKGYPVDANAMFVEDPEDDNYEVEVLADNSNPKMKGEEIVAKLDAMFGKIVRIDFDGKIDSGNDSETSVHFYAIGANDADREKVDGTWKYFYDFVNEDGVAERIYADSTLEATVKGDLNNGAELTGSYVVVTLNEDNEMEEIQYIVKDGEFDTLTEVLFGDSGEDEFYRFLSLSSDDYETSKGENKNWFMSGEEQVIKANEDTILVKVLKDEDKITVDFETGLTAIEKEMRTSQDVVAIYDASAVRMRAKYLVVIADGSDNSEFEVAVVDSIKAGNDVYVGDTVIKLADSADKDNKEIIDTLLLRDNESNSYNDYELVVYTVTTKEVNNKTQRTFNFKSGLRTDELNISNTHGVVTEYDSSDDSFFIENDTNEYTLESVRETYEDRMIVLVNVVETETEGQYEVESYDVVDAAKATIKNEDRISVRTEADVLFIIRGMEK